MELLSDHTVDAAEKLIATVGSGAAGASLRIATNSRSVAAGGEPSVVQAVVTWAQGEERPMLETYAADRADGQVEDLPRRLVGLVAALVCDGASAMDGSQIGPELRRAALGRLDVLQGWDPRSGSRGQQIEILCVDHLDRSYPRTLYEPPGPTVRSVLPARAFKDLGELVLGTMNLASASAGLPRGFSAAVGDALYELFRNTDQHARTDFAGNHLRRSVRGIHARRHSLSPAALDTMVAGSPPLATFCRRRRPRAGRSNIELVEFSVFDSGPGMAARWLARPPRDLEDELRAVVACFKRHGTSQAQRGRGIGLPIVVAALRERHGFLRLRTGKQSLYADLGQEGQAAFGTDPELLPWPKAGALARAAGTLVTFLLPVEDP